MARCCCRWTRRRCAVRGRAAARGGIEAVAVCFLHSFTNEAHERRAGAILRRGTARRRRSPSPARSAPEIREYERASTTIANAYVLPLMSRYLGRLEAGLRARASPRRCC